jgi:hypothetical protein
MIRFRRAGVPYLTGSSALRLFPAAAGSGKFGSAPASAGTSSFVVRAAMISDRCHFTEARPSDAGAQLLYAQWRAQRGEAELPAPLPTPASRHGPPAEIAPGVVCGLISPVTWEAMKLTFVVVAASVALRCIKGHW